MRIKPGSARCGSVPAESAAVTSRRARARGGAPHQAAGRSTAQPLRRLVERSRRPALTARAAHQHRAAGTSTTTAAVLCSRAVISYQQHPSANDCSRTQSNDFRGKR